MILEHHKEKNPLSYMEKAIVLVFTGVSIAVMALPFLLNSIYLLVKDVFGAILLPFVLLSSMGENTDTTTYTFGTNEAVLPYSSVTSHFPYNLVATFCLIGGIALFFLVRRDYIYPITRISGVILTLAAISLAQWPAWVFILPALTVQFYEMVKTFYILRQDSSKRDR